MKLLLSILLLSTVFFSCRKDDNPIQEQKVKVVDKIEIKKTYSGSPNIVIDRIDFTYNANKEISKISTFENDVPYYSYTYVYQNNIPVSSMYDFTFGGDPVYEVRYSYTNGKFSRYYDTYYDDATTFSYNEQFNQYTNSINGNRFILNEFDDISVRTG